MTHIYVKYNPYKLQTTLKVDGNVLERDSAITRAIEGKRLQEWIGSFPYSLADELNSVDFEVEFYGMKLDWDDFEEAFNLAKKQGTIRNLSLKFTEGKSDEAINQKIINIFGDLREGPVDDFRDIKLIKIFNNVLNDVFPINVIATMSSGKSTLINSLLNKKLMPSKNEACTAVITEILDNDSEDFSAYVFDENGIMLREIPNLTYDIMNELNGDERVSRISAEGNIPFLDSNNTALQLVDTPGPNNAQNQNHKNTTYNAIRSESNNLILYVLNGTQLSTNDDDNLLSFVSEQIQKGGKQARDRFLFVINKMDSFNPEEESIEKAVQSAKKYLSKHGINDPQIFPCSAYAALNIRTLFKDIDLSNLTMAEFSKLPSAAKDTYAAIEKFNSFEDMHLEKYSTLSPSAQNELNYRLKKAEENSDVKEQALIHCGIYSIEAAITAYVKKYARTKKVKDLVESFKEVLDSNRVLAKAKQTVSENEEAAKACAERARIIKEKIADGTEAAEFKAKIDKLNPMPAIEEKADALTDSAERKTTRIFSNYGETIDNRAEAMRLVSTFTTLSSDLIAEMSANLESVINSEIVDTGEKYLKEYQEKLTKIDEAAGISELDFQTVDLVKGAMSKMRETAAAWCSNDFADSTVNDLGEETVEEKTYYEKVGEKEEKVWVGEHQEFVGTEKVKVGSRKEKIGTRKVKNPERSGFWGFFKFWEPKYIDEDICKDVDVYEDKDIYKTVQDFATVMRDVMEERTQKIVKYNVKTSDIQMGLVSQFRKNIDEGVGSALSYAEEQINRIKEQFNGLFGELDALIEEKYDELNSYADEQKTSEEELEKNRNILNWIEGNISEIHELLEI
ncbi:MAG: dynamin family protein [Ruminococcus sp.]|nr:dynamin family protein [Ruminococcus sp.]MCM1381710.1 dynamin family protein [Muribaculaceae bacterium]MCM1480595.1 dynamin family protein [Muribaculaceae bacterium]